MGHIDINWSLFLYLAIGIEQCLHFGIYPQSLHIFEELNHFLFVMKSIFFQLEIYFFILLSVNSQKSLLGQASRFTRAIFLFSFSDKIYIFININYELDRAQIRFAIGKNIDATITHTIPAINTINIGSIKLISHHTFVSISSL